MRFEVTLLLLATVAVALPAEPGANDARDLSGQTPVNGPKAISRDSSDNALIQNLRSLSAAVNPSLRSNLSYNSVFRPQPQLLPVPDEFSSEIDEMMHALRDDMVALRRLYSSILDWVESKGSVASDYRYADYYQDIIVKYPLPEATNKLCSEAEGYEKQLYENQIEGVAHGYLGAAKEKHVEEAVGLVNKYLKLINNYDLLPILEKAQNDPVSTYWAEVIGRNDPYQVRYFLYDIMAFQVIPRVAIWYTIQEKLDLAIQFIDAMMNDNNLTLFLQSIPNDTVVNYYEQAAYMALQIGLPDAGGFLKLVRGKPEFNINRLYDCAPELKQPEFKQIIEEATDITLAKGVVGTQQCLRFMTRLNRAAKISNSVEA